MSFVVEIPSVFTKPTQIPVRLGNTILTGNETIQGSLSVNGSITLNSGDNVDNTNIVYYDSLDISSNLNVGGDVSISGDLVVDSVNVIDKFDELDADIATKQDLIISSTDLTINSLITDDLEVKGSVSINTLKSFDTIVVRRISGDTTKNIILNELQCWVNNVNILALNSSTLTSYFADWNNNDTPITAFTFQGILREASRIYNNLIETDFGPHSASGSNVLIIKNIPLTSVNEIQSIVLYHRKLYNDTSIIGLAIELYNSVNDPNLNTILANTNTISTFVYIYRFNFPSIDTYSGSFSSADSTTQIASDTYATTEHANVISFPTEIIGDLTISGELVVDSVNAAFIPGFQKTISAGLNMSVINDVVKTLDTVNFSSITVDILNNQYGYMRYYRPSFVNMTGTEYFIPFNGTGTNGYRPNTALLTQSGDTFTVVKAGYYRIFTTACFKNQTYNDRVIYQLTIMVNDSSTYDNNGQGNEGFCYVRHNEYGNRGQASAQASWALSIGDTIQVRVACGKASYVDALGDDLTGLRLIPSPYIEFNYMG